MFIVAFTGVAGSGKTTAADFIVDRYGALKLSFAKPLREEVVALGGFDKDLVYAKPTDPDVRQLLQAWGTLRRKSNPDHWADLMFDRVLWAMNSPNSIPGIVTIDDLRYKNEESMLRVLDSQFGIPVLIVRMLGNYRPLGKEHSEHSSEREIRLINEDVQVDNSITTREQMYSLLQDIVNNYADSLIFREDDFVSEVGDNSSKVYTEQGCTPR